MSRVSHSSHEASLRMARVRQKAPKLTNASAFQVGAPFAYGPHERADERPIVSLARLYERACP